ncbi:MAG: sensor histidine kinase [Oligoflexia bacterium]|nr:MAG: sensor histidine kinase [Oligoflexia bacterium]
MKLRYFPLGLFWKLFSTTVLYFGLVSIAAFFAASYVFHFPLHLWTTILFLIGLIFVLVLAGVWIAYQFSLPFGRVIMKAFRLAYRKQFSSDEDEDEEDLLSDEPGEYVELERALYRIRRKLKKRKVQLAHEREETRALMGALVDPVLSVGLDGKLVFFNSSFATHFMTRAQVHVASEGGLFHISEIIRDPTLVEMVDGVLKSGQIQNLQIRLNTVQESGGRIYSVIISPLYEEKNRSTLYGALMLFHDITEMKQAERIRVEFVENASHELRTPLTSIKGYLSTLQEDVQAERKEQIPTFFNILNKNVDRLIELVNDLLTISSLENNSPLDIEYVYPEQMTFEVIERLAKLASERKIVIRTTAHVPSFKADPLKIEQVLMNLIGNAIKYNNEGGSVEVIWEFDQEKKNILLRVKDNGPGISEEHMGRLFERFYRVDKGRSRDVGGTGLGLSIVKHITQCHGGSVKALSQVGLGSEFICSFPVRS